MWKPRLVVVGRPAEISATLLINRTAVCIWPAIT